MKNEIVKFANKEINTFEKDGVVYVAMKPIIEALGLAWNKQFELIKRDYVLNSTITVTGIVAKDGKSRNMSCLPLKYLNGYLFKVNANRYKGDKRETIAKYQMECYEVLFNYWNNGGAINSRASEEQLTVLHSELNMVKPTSKYGSISSLTCQEKKCLVKSYFRSGKNKNEKKQKEVSDMFQPELI